MLEKMVIWFLLCVGCILFVGEHNSVDFCGDGKVIRGITH